MSTIEPVETDPFGDGRTIGEAERDLRGRLRAMEAGHIDATRESGYPYRFTPEWARSKWGRLLGDGERRAEWASNTVMLTFTASSAYPGTDTPVPPLRHFRLLTASRNAVTTALSRSLDAVDQAEATTVFGVHERGTIHAHTGIWVGARVDQERFANVIAAHVRCCPLATEEAHEVGTDPREGAVTVYDGDSVGLTNELGFNVPGLASGGEGHGLLGEAYHRRVGAAVLWAADVRPVRR